MFWVITASSSPRRSSSASASWARFGCFVAEVGEARPVVAPEAARVAVEGVDVGDLHRVDLRPQPRPRGAEVGNPRGHRDPGPGQRDDRARAIARCSCGERSAPVAPRRSLRPATSGCACRGRRAMPSFASSLWKAVGEALLLGLDPLVEVALVGDVLDLLDRERRLAGELARPGERGLEQLVVGDDPVGEPVARAPRRRRSRRRSGSSPAPCSGRPAAAAAGCRRSRG